MLSGLRWKVSVTCSPGSLYRNPSDWKIVDNLSSKHIGNNKHHKTEFMKERIRQVMEHTKMSQQDFATKLGISPASLSSIFTGRTNPTNNHVQAVHRAFPEVNINWLLFGEGEMYLERDKADKAGGQANAGAGSTLSGADAPHSGGAGKPSLFLEDAFDAGLQEASRPATTAVQQRRDGVYPRRNEARINMYAKEMDKPVRKIKEIRVFFDDGTYESFVPSGK